MGSNSNQNIISDYFAPAEKKAKIDDQRPSSEKPTDQSINRLPAVGTSTKDEENKNNEKGAPTPSRHEEGKSLEASTNDNNKPAGVNGEKPKEDKVQTQKIAVNDIGLFQTNSLRYYQIIN